MCLDVLHPVPDVVERRLVCHVVHQQDTHGAPVVGCNTKRKWDTVLSKIEKCEQHRSGQSSRLTEKCRSAGS